MNIRQQAAYSWLRSAGQVYYHINWPRLPMLAMKHTLYCQTLFLLHSTFACFQLCANAADLLCSSGGFYVGLFCGRRDV